MSDKRFVDSNVWLYAFMDSASPKRQQAMRLIAEPGIVLGVQVLNEVCNNLLRKAGYSEAETHERGGVS